LANIKLTTTYPAKDAGLRVGDIIIEVNGQAVTTINNLVININKAIKKRVILVI
jgi:S1-C subfamily serine protease